MPRSSEDLTWVMAILQPYRAVPHDLLICKPSQMEDALLSMAVGLLWEKQPTPSNTRCQLLTQQHMLKRNGSDGDVVLHNHGRRKRFWVIKISRLNKKNPQVLCYCALFHTE